MSAWRQRPSGKVYQWAGLPKPQGKAMFLRVGDGAGTESEQGPGLLKEKR